MHPFYQHQLGTVNKSLNLDYLLDFSDAGTGKTRSAIEIFNKKKTKKAKLLVLTTKSTMYAAWGATIEQFFPNLTYQIAYPPKDSRKDTILNSTADVIITNHDAVNELVKLNFPSEYKFLIIDESTAFKNPVAKRTKNALKLAEQFSDFRLIMSGTPTPKSLLDIYTQVTLADLGKHLGKSYYAFRNVVSVKQMNYSGFAEWIVKPDAEKAVASAIQHFTVRNKFEDCISIPPNTVNKFVYPLSDKLQAKYDELIKNAMMIIDSNRAFNNLTNTKTKQEEMIPINAAVLSNKLAQVCSGAVYYDNKTYEVIDKDRIINIIDLVQERSTVQGVIAFNWQHQKDLLIQELDHRNITWVLIDGSVSQKQRDENIINYQNGNIQVFLLQPASAAHGITLTQGRYTLWASPTYNVEHFIQLNKRIYRAGQKHKTETIVQLAQNTIEEKRIYELLTAKNTRMFNLLELLC